MNCDTCNKETPKEELKENYPFKGKSCLKCRKLTHKIGGH